MYINRYNVFSYSYVLNKIYRILKKEEQAKYLKLFKCRWKLRGYDNIWRKYGDFIRRYNIDGNTKL